MFGPMKEALRGIRISSDEEVIGAVQNWLKTQPKTNCVFGLYPSSGVSRTNKIKNYRQKIKPK
jgi:hypothetical protein